MTIANNCSLALEVRKYSCDLLHYFFFQETNNNNFFFQLPRMLKKDAIAQYYGLERGQVVKVTYSGEITESHVTYRCVW